MESTETTVTVVIRVAYAPLLKSSHFRASPSLGFRVHDEVIFTTQVHAGIKLNRPGWNKSQSQRPGDCHEMNLHFDTRKMLPDAVSRPCGKRNRRQSMPIF